MGEAGYTELHSAALRGDLHTVTECVEGLGGRRPVGVNVRTKGLGGAYWTPLHYAARYGHSHVVRYLLDSGADRLVGDYYSKTPEDYAQAEGFGDCAALLQSYTPQKRRPSLAVEHSVGNQSARVKAASERIKASAERESTSLTAYARSHNVPVFGDKPVLAFSERARAMARMQNQQGKRDTPLRIGERVW